MQQRAQLEPTVGGRPRAQEELVAVPPGRERLAQRAVQEAAVDVSPATRALAAAALAAQEALPARLEQRRVVRGRNSPDVESGLELQAGQAASQHGQPVAEELPLLLPERVVAPAEEAPPVLARWARPMLAACRVDHAQRCRDVVVLALLRHQERWVVEH